MKGVGAGLGDDVDLATEDLALIGGQDAPHDLDFLDRIDAHDIDVVAALIGAQPAAFRIGIGVGAIYRDTAAVLAYTAEAYTPGFKAALNAQPDGQPEDVGQIAATDRQLHDLDRLQGFPLLGTGRAHQRSAALDCDYFGHFAYFNNVSLAHCLTSSQGNASGHRRLESRHLDRECVSTNRQEVESKLTGVAADCCPLCSGSFVDQCHVCSRNECVGLIPNDAIKCGSH